MCAGDDETTPVLEVDLARAIAENSRSWGGTWYWKDKPVGERGAADEILRSAGLVAEGLVSRAVGEDPPDCEAVIDGLRYGIEVTELIHEKTLKHSLKGDPQFFVWDRSTLLLKLQSLIDRKDQPHRVKGGPYDRYILVIPTDEFFLARDNVTEFLNGAEFHAKMITDVFFGLPYHPPSEDEMEGSYPVFRLSILTDR